ncbi:MAG: hypothetical protein LQ337_004423 [Flavoplaca oasis]|nr:MAG: hypothetical protein LQ337_004423 [Flavoplaca oasis]
MAISFKPLPAGKAQKPHNCIAFTTDNIQCKTAKASGSKGNKDKTFDPPILADLCWRHGKMYEDGKDVCVIEGGSANSLAADQTGEQDEPTSEIGTTSQLGPAPRSPDFAEMGRRHSMEVSMFSQTGWDTQFAQPELNIPGIQAHGEDQASHYQRLDHILGTQSNFLVNKLDGLLKDVTKMEEYIYERVNGLYQGVEQVYQVAERLDKPIAQTSQGIATLDEQHRKGVQHVTGEISKSHTSMQSEARAQNHNIALLMQKLDSLTLKVEKQGQAQVEANGSRTKELLQRIDAQKNVVDAATAKFTMKYADTLNHGQQ